MLAPGPHEAIWPVYRDKQIKLPTGLAQARYTRFLKLSPLDLATAAPLVAAFSEFLSDDDAWRRYDELSFRDLCTKLGVSRKLYREAFEPMILTGLVRAGRAVLRGGGAGHGVLLCPQEPDGLRRALVQGQHRDLIFARMRVLRHRHAPIIAAMACWLTPSPRRHAAVGATRAASRCRDTMASRWKTTTR